LSFGLIKTPIIDCVIELYRKIKSDSPKWILLHCIFLSVFFSLNVKAHFEEIFLKFNKKLNDLIRGGLAIVAIAARLFFGNQGLFFKNA
jgi:hypothetical protein